MKDFKGPRKSSGFGGTSKFKSEGGSRGGFGGGERTERSSRPSFGGSRSADRGGRPSFGGDRGGDRGGRGGFGGDRGGRPSFGGGDRPMYKASCAECGKDCEVPFKPNGAKPVLCSTCFAESQGDTSRSQATGSYGGSSKGFTDKFNSYEKPGKALFKAVCEECGSKCEVPFRPVEGKKVLCDSCFQSSGQATKAPVKHGVEFKEYLEQLNSKLDKILSLLNSDERKMVMVSEVVKGVKDIKAKVEEVKEEPKKTAKVKEEKTEKPVKTAKLEKVSKVVKEVKEKKVTKKKA